MRRELELTLLEIMSELSRIEEATREIDEAEWLRRHGELDTILRALHRLSRCVRSLPYEFTSARPEVPWARLASLGPELEGAEFRMDPRAVWRAVREDLPVLKREILGVVDGLRYRRASEEEE
ncbi:MAG: HepT-like ribonuclease domain-containing protein [Thermoplasmata archaeon]